MVSTRTRRTIAFTIAASMLAVACSKVPYTQRRQYNIIPKGVMDDLGRTSYVAALQDNRVVERGENVEVLERVGANISGAVPEQGFAWEYSLLASEQANAWALPGGYIAFYTGILPALRNEAGMAFVMGHEVGHATANHSAERLSQQLTLLGGLQVVDLYLSRQSALSQQQRGLIMAALGLGAEVGVLLPYSRLHEHEADIIGMMNMAAAGYPPGQSIEVWDRMAELGDSRPPIFLSTHPSPEGRQEVLAEWMPRARKRYQRNALPYDTTVTLWPMSGDERRRVSTTGPDDAAP